MNRSDFSIAARHIYEESPFLAEVTRLLCREDEERTRRIDRALAAQLKRFPKRRCPLQLRLDFGNAFADLPLFEAAARRIGEGS